MANARWKAGSLPPEQRRERELDTVDWKGRIRNALDEHRLVLYAQPIIDVNSRKVVMQKLLVRMVDHDGAIIAPGRFLPAAEERGLIEEIDRWVIIQAAQLAADGLKAHTSTSPASHLVLDRLVEDLVGGLGPDEWSGAVVVPVYVVLDGCDELGNVVVDAAADLLFGEDREPDSRTCSFTR